MLTSGISRWWQVRKELLEERRVRRLERKSLDSKGKGWLFDPKDDEQLYILGISLNLANPCTPGYSIDFLEDQYRALKQEMVQQHPHFDFSRHKKVVEVEAGYAASLLSDNTTLHYLRPVIERYRDLETGRYDKIEVGYLESPIIMDGDQVTLRIAPGGYYMGYGIFVYDHPDFPLSEGKWCRPNSIGKLVAVVGEYTL